MSTHLRRGTPSRLLRSMATLKSKISPANLNKFRYTGRGRKSKMVPEVRTDRGEDMEVDDSEDSTRGNISNDCPLTYASMTEIAADIKNSFSVAITDIKT